MGVDDNGPHVGGRASQDRALVARRTVLASAAIAVPAVMVTVAAPAFASSGQLLPTVRLLRSLVLAGEVIALEVEVRDDSGTPSAGVSVTLSVDGVEGVIDSGDGITDGRGILSALLWVQVGIEPGTGVVTAMTASAHASASFDVVDDKLIRHSIDGTTTRVVALPHGDQTRFRVAENRGMSHSDLQPTGRWVRSGDVVTVDVEGSPTWWLELAIGSRGPMAVFRSDGTVDFARTVLPGGRTTLTADRDGLLFLVNHSEWSAVVVNISGGNAQPVWIDGSTDPADFAREMEAFAAAPVVTHVSQRVFADIQRSVLDVPDVKREYDPGEMSARLDRVRRETDDVYGLRYGSVGVARKHPGRVYIAGPDSGGAYAFATEGWLSLHVSHGASAALATGSDHWVLWHEIGHTYQTLDYTWTGLLEVTVNISSLAIEQRERGSNTLDRSPDVQERLTRYFAQPVVDRRFADLVSESPFFPLMMFDQLRRSFGEGFYPAVSQAYRIRRATGERAPLSDQEKIDLFAEVTSEVAGRDLGPFYTQWGLGVSRSSLAIAASWAPLANDIWTALLSNDSPVERNVPYGPPTGSLSGAPRSVYLGQTDTAGVRVISPTESDGSRCDVVRTGVVAAQIGSDAGRVFAVLRARDGASEALTQLVDVTAVSVLEFVGLGDVMIGSIGLSADGKRLVATSLGNPAHSYFSGTTYYRVDVLTSAGRVVASATVRGEDSAAPVVSALNGLALPAGAMLAVRSAEPTRVRIYQDDQPAGTLTRTTQIVRTVDGRFAI